MHSIYIFISWLHDKLASNIPFCHEKKAAPGVILTQSTQTEGNGLFSSGRFHGAAVARGSHEVYLWGSSKEGHGECLGTEPKVGSETHIAPPRHSSISSPMTTWRPSSAELVKQFPLEEVEVPPKQPSISWLLSRLPPTLRQGLRDTDPEGELPEKDVFR